MDSELLQRRMAVVGHGIRPLPCTGIYPGETGGNQTEPFPTSSAGRAWCGEALARTSMELPAAQAAAPREHERFLLWIQHSVYYIYY